MWDGGKLIDLNSLLDFQTRQAGWVLIDAAGINNRGDITGQARNILTGQEHAYLLAAPVPEPAAWIMVLAGLLGDRHSTRSRVSPACERRQLTRWVGAGACG